MCPRTQQQFDQIRFQSIQNISDAALELFADRGYSATSIAMIAKKAKISKGLIYNYFDSKHELLVHIMSNAFELVHDFIDEDDLQKKDPREVFSKTIKDALELVNQNKGYFRLLTSLMLHPDMLDEMLEIGNLAISRVQRFSKELFVKLGSDDPDRDAYLLDSMLDGIGMYIIMGYNAKPIDDIHRYICDKFLLKHDQN